MTGLVCIVAQIQNCVDLQERRQDAPTEYTSLLPHKRCQQLPLLIDDPPVLNQGSRMKMDKAQTFQRNKEPRALLNPLLLCSNKHLVQLKVCRKRQFMRILKYPTPLKYFKIPYTLEVHVK